MESSPQHLAAAETLVPQNLVLWSRNVTAEGVNGVPGSRSLEALQNLVSESRNVTAESVNGVPGSRLSDALLKLVSESQNLAPGIVSPWSRLLGISPAPHRCHCVPCLLRHLLESVLAGEGGKRRTQMLGYGPFPASISRMALFLLAL